MEQYYFSTSKGNATALHIAPITDEKINQSGQCLVDSSGYFLYETDQSQQPASVRIIAQCLSDEAAIELSVLLNME